MDSGLLRSLDALSDPARLRLLRLIEREELSVGELARVLQLPQSTVSRHLKLLHEGDWVERRTEGTAALYRMAPAELETGAARLWDVVRGRIGPPATIEEDDHRLAEVLAERRTDGKDFFGRLGGQWDRLRVELFGDRFIDEALLCLLDPEWTVADLGCGTGSTVELLAPVVKEVVAVDREPTMLDAARARLARFTNVSYHQADVTNLPLKAGCVDAAVLSLVLVYVPRPEQALAQAARLLRPGGRVLIVDLVPHDRESYRHTMGHQHLGFDESAVAGWAGPAGLAPGGYRRLRADMAAKGPGLFAATMRAQG